MSTYETEQIDEAIAAIAKAMQALHETIGVDSIVLDEAFDDLMKVSRKLTKVKHTVYHGTQETNIES